MFVHISYCQQTFDPFPKQISDKYHLDFSIFYKSEAEARKDLDKLYQQLNKFWSLKGKTNSSANNLLSALRQQDSILILYNHLWAFYDLHASVSRFDYESRNIVDKINIALTEKTSFFELEVADLSQARFASFINEKPSLAKYSYYVQNLARIKPHLLPELLQEKYAAVSSLISGWQYDLYEKIMAGISFSSIETTKGKLNVFRDRTVIETNPDTAIRAEGFQKLYEGLNSSRSLFAFTLIQLAKAQDQDAKHHGFANAPEAFYFAKFYNKEGITSLLKQIADSAGLYRYYQKIRKEYLAKQSGTLQNFRLWDMKGSLNKFLPRFDIDSATGIILKSMLPLGNQYQGELSKLLDPANGRMEIAPSKTKRSGGFSRGFIGTASIFYSGNYLGLYNDMRILAHEATHAVHRELMNQNHILPVYASGPNYLFESFAIFSEFLLSDYLINSAKSVQEKIFYLEKYFDGKGMALFSITQDALLEQSIHEGVVSGAINSEVDLDSINAVINNQFSIWPTDEYPQQNQRWITNTLFYEDPFYNVNYVLGAMLALKYYDLYKKDKEAFQQGYITLLKNGFTDSPAPLLMRCLKVDINSPVLLSNAIGIIRCKVMELEELYKQ